ncbi:hypothetical protein KP79_PYT23792 [Mizuhopecten yessoensis]|uniref:Uncharacterized protein n=1 Tax=Mizuhopecten yessoensis TaxID=6573 RepID=A0A210QZV6_MIZYE|nr:hypothetical protein KP79_PYT23792 [Mizuhopecten yessoensis]
MLHKRTEDTVYTESISSASVKAALRSIKIMKVMSIVWGCVTLLLLSALYLEVEAHSCYADGPSCVDRGGECDSEGGICFMLPPVFDGEVRCCCTVTDDCAGVPKSSMMKKIEL